MRGAESGAALIVVIGALSALAVPATLLLLSASLAYEIEAYSAEIAQARELANAVRLQVERAVSGGRLELPDRGRPVVVRNGVLSGGGTVPVGRFPAVGADPGWPALSDGPPAGPSPTLGLGARITLEAATGPRGELRDIGGVGGDDFLVDVEVEVWFRRARLVEGWRYRWREGRFERLD